MIIEKIATCLFANRLRSIKEFELFPDLVQSQQLQKNLNQAKKTEWGRLYDFASIKTYQQFSQTIPICDYNKLKPFIERMMQGENNILWPEKISWFAKSSGTSNDKSKFIPVSPCALKDCHYRGAKDTVATYLDNVIGSSLFSAGKSLVLGGCHKPSSLSQNIQFGDLSAILIENMNPIANKFRSPSKEIILMDEWEAKLNAICQKTIKESITNISGVPSWMLVLIKKILSTTNCNDLSEIWPKLEVFFHGGINFDPYRENYKKIISSPTMKYMETYNASEGFFALQNDLDEHSLLLLLDYGIFYEFIPLEDINKENPTTICLTDIELNKNYAILISTNSGLWRYLIGDTVMFTSSSPYKLIITGRTKHFINAFGEELMVHNTDKALAAACQATQAKICEYTLAPVYISAKEKGKHQWLIEFEEMPNSMDLFCELLDKNLKDANSDYEAKRYKNITLDKPEIILAQNGLFYRWLKIKGKLGGQHKVPRLSNSREYIEPLLLLNQQNEGSY